MLLRMPGNKIRTRIHNIASGGTTRALAAGQSTSKYAIMMEEETDG